MSTYGESKGSGQASCEAAPPYTGSRDRRDPQAQAPQSREENPGGSRGGPPAERAKEDGKDGKIQGSER